MKTGTLVQKLETLAWKWKLGSLEDNGLAFLSESFVGYVDIHSYLGWHLSLSSYMLPENAVIENDDAPHPSLKPGFETAVKIADKLGCLSLCLDTGHAGITGENIIEIWDRYGERIKVIHFSDYKADSTDLKKEHRPPGEGDLPLGEFLQAVYETDQKRKERGKDEIIIIIELMPIGRWNLRGIPLGLNHQTNLDRVRRTHDFILEHIA